MRGNVLVVAVVLAAAAGHVGLAGGTAGATPDATAEPTLDAGVPSTASTAGTPPSGDDPPAILAAYPNPVRDEDRGEYVVVRHPGGEGWTLTDGEATVPLPPDGGRLVVSRTPGLVGPNVSGRPVEAPDDLRLANGGERLELRRNGTTVDALAYADAPESEVLRAATGEWTPRGATAFRVLRAGPAPVRAFVLPDGRAVPVDAIERADERVLLAGYTLSSWRVARALVAARERGATVRVMVEGGPVGGISERQAAVLDFLVARGVDVAALSGPRARYAYHHPKYAVLDGRALVTTENWKPAGTGGRSNRGWGAVVDSGRVADHLAAVFRADAGWRDATAWSRFRRNRSFEPASPANGSYPARFRPRTVRASSVRVLAAPDNAERELVRVIQGAEQEVLVQQVSVGGRHQPFLAATVAAARRGVRVRVLLSSAWYVREENRRLVEWLNGLSAREGLPLAARLAEPRSRYGTIHAKGVVVDGETVVVGSVNWNNHSARENREVALVLEGDEVGTYYARAFRADWRGGTRRVPAGVLVALGVAGVGGAVAARRVSFERP